MATATQRISHRISLGVRRALQQCSLPNNTFSMLALDQRGSLIKMLGAATNTAQDDVPYSTVTGFKREAINILSPLASAVLLDPEWGYPTCVASGALNGSSGLLMSYEKSGYEGDPTERRTALMDDWGVEQMQRAGASGVKLLVYYRPDADNASAQEEVVKEVADECKKWDMPLFLEPLHYSTDPELAKVENSERREIVVESAKRLVPLGVTILKAEFPVDITQTDDEDEWAESCRALSEAIDVPWVLLSAGVDYDLYERQVRVACNNGASGILCGRAVWKESVDLQDTKRTDFIQNTSTKRFRALADMVEQNGRPWTDFYPADNGDDLEDWYKK